MAKNDLIRKRNNERQIYLEYGEKTAMQLMCDAAVLVLNDEFGFGADRCEKFIKSVETQYNFYHLAVEGDTESDVRQEHLERRLRKILGDKYDPFEKRYEFIKPITYEVRKHRHK